MTKVQMLTLQRIVSHKNLNKQYPTLGKLGRHFGVSRHSIMDRITALVKKGYLVNEDGVYIPTIDGIEQYMQDVMSGRFKKSR